MSIRHEPMRECYKLLRGWKAKRLVESLWLAELRGPAWEIRDHVLAAFGGSASVAVIELFSNGDWAITRAYKEGADWLQKHMSTY